MRLRVVITCLVASSMFSSHPVKASETMSNTVTAAAGNEMWSSDSCKFSPATNLYTLNGNVTSPTVAGCILACPKHIDKSKEIPAYDAWLEKKITMQEKKSVADYLQTYALIMKQIDILKQNASSCGFIGGNISNAITTSLKNESADLPNFLTAVEQGFAGKPVLLKQRTLLNNGVKEMADHLDMLRYGLSTDDVNCKKASTAFEELRRMAILQPRKLQKVITEIAQLSIVSSN